jgi:hypothetical protein
VLTQRLYTVQTPFTALAAFLAQVCCRADAGRVASIEKLTAFS